MSGTLKECIQGPLGMYGPIFDSNFQNESQFQASLMMLKMGYVKEEKSYAKNIQIKSYEYRVEEDVVFSCEFEEDMGAAVHPWHVGMKRVTLTARVHGPDLWSV